MYDISYKNVKKGYSIAAICLIVGISLLLILGCIAINKVLKKKSLDSTVEATRIIDNCNYNSDDDMMCSPIYYFIVDNVEYKCETTGSSSLMVNSSNNKVYYDSANPSNCLTEYDNNTSFITYLVLIIPIVSIILAISNFIKTNKRVKKIKYLAEHGTLYKGLRYRLEPTGMQVNNRDILAPVIDFTLPNGSILRIKGDPIMNGKMADQDGLMDLLIDLNDPNNNYVDFEINYKK